MTLTLGDGGLAVVAGNDCGQEKAITAESCDFEATMVLPVACVGSDYVFVSTCSHRMEPLVGSLDGN